MPKTSEKTDQGGRSENKMSKEVIQKIIDGKIMPSFKVIAKVGEVAGESIEIAARDGEFLSKDDLRQRAKIGQSAIDKLSELGILGDMTESNQLSLFDL